MKSLIQTINESLVTEAKKEYLLNIPSKDVQPSDLNDILKDLTKMFGRDMVEPYEGDEADDNFIQYIILTDKVKKLEDFAKDHDAEFKEYEEE